MNLDDLIGEKLGLNQYGNMTYKVGLVEKYLSGEFSYQGSGCEGYFIANLCLYLLAGEADPKTFFTKEDDLIFLEHFVFHNIPKKTFLEKMSESSNEEERVNAICDLIKSSILLKTGIRFHDFYVNGYQEIHKEDKNHKAIYCQHLLELFKKSGLNANWTPPNSWNGFYNSCKDHNIKPSLISAPLTPEMAVESLKKETAAYLKSLSNLKKDSLVKKKIELINNLTDILNNPNEDERKKELTSFINNRAHIEALSRRRYSLKGYDHAAAVFFKNLVLYLPLILDIVTLGTVKWFSHTHKSLTERAYSSLFKVKGAAVIAQVSEYIASTQNKKE